MNGNMNEELLPERLAAYRRAANLTQEQAAELLGVSRQAVSRWESGQARPATERLMRLCQLYGCPPESLFGVGAAQGETPFASTAQGGGEPPSAGTAQGATQSAPPAGAAGVWVNLSPLVTGTWSFERVSRHKLGSLPLWHINVGPGRTARGVVALGLRARGVVAVGLLAQGVIAAGVFPLGGIALGAIALGLVALGAVAVGVVALGAIALGALAIGALAVGDFAVGALALGRYAALGDHARADVAIGFTRAAGGAFEAVGALSAAAREEALRALAATPWHLGWARAIFELFI